MAGTSMATSTAWHASSNHIIDAEQAAVLDRQRKTETGSFEAFTVRARDNGGAVSSTTTTLEITVNAINDAPIFSGDQPTLTTISEDPITVTGERVSDSGGRQLLRCR